MLEQEKNEEIISHLKQIGEKISVLENKIIAQEERLNKIESAKEPVIVNVSAPQSQNPIYSSSLLSDQKEIADNSQKVKKNEDNSLEQNIGGKLFAKIGIAALVIGVAFFIKYAFDNNWINETGRVAIGVIVGLVLLFLGNKTSKKYFTYSQILSGGGISILYLSIFAAFNFYHLISQPVAFFVMALITAMGIAMSFYYDSVFLIVVSIIGGFSTPFLLSTGVNNQFGLFFYILILDSAILFVSFFKKWREFNIVGFIGTILVFSVWFSQFYTNSQLFSTIFFLTIFFIIYSISSLIFNLIYKEKSSGIEQFLTLMSGVIYFASSYTILNRDYHDFMGLFSVIIAIYYLIWVVIVRKTTPDDVSLYGFLVSLAIGFITLAIPIQFKQNIITIGWLIEAVILLTLGLKIRKDTVKSFGVAVFLLAATKLLFVDSMAGKPDDLVVFNKIFLTFIFAIAGGYLMTYLIKKYSSEDSAKESFFQTKSIIIMFIIIANFFTLFSISREVNFYYEKQVNGMKKELSNPSLNYSGVHYNTPQFKGVNDSIEKIENKKSITLSLFWLLYGIILIGIGIIKRSKILRIGGLAVLMISISKLFFYDLWSLGTLYRIISSISLGVVLLSISFVYQKYKDKLKEIISVD
jgi:uncharacterized membrane protein